MSTGASFAADGDIVIKGGTEVLVKTTERLKSNQVHTGQTIRFTVERAVVDDNGVTLIEGGAPAWGTVTKVAKAGLFGAGGKLGITIDSVEAYNGKVIQLSGNKNNDGENVAGVAIIGGLFVAWPALLFRGSNAVIEAGTIFSAYVASTTVIEEAEEDVSDTTVLEEAEEDVPAAPKPTAKKKPAAKKKTATGKKTTKKRR